MTAKEMHIELDVRLQHINSNRKDTLRSEIKDVIINQSILEVVDSRLPSKYSSDKKGLEDNTVLYEDLKELTKRASLSTYVDSNVSDSVYCVLPVDYYHLKNDRSTVAYNCNGITFPSTTNTTEQYYVLSFPDDNTSGAKYASFTIKYNGVLGTIYSYTSHTLYTKEAKFQIVNEVLDYVNKIQTISNGAGSSATFEAYWEYFDNLFYQDSFIFRVITAAASMSTAILTYTGYAGSATALSTYTRPYYNYSYSTTNTYSNRLVPTDAVYNMNEDYYGKTWHTSPLSVLDLQRLRVYHNDNFIVRYILIEYIKRPRFINVSMNISSDLNIKMQKEVLDVAARKAASMINDPAYKNYIMENQISNQ